MLFNGPFLAKPESRRQTQSTRPFQWETVERMEIRKQLTVGSEGK